MNKDKELISIIVPIYNVEKYLKNCINSILSQTYQNIEVILVDDGSPDNCPTICDEYGVRDDRIKVIHQKNQGLSGARNTGIEKAVGEYLVFVDSDDTIEPTMVEMLYIHAINNNCNMAACGRNYVFEDGKVISKSVDKGDTVFEFSDAIIEMNRFELFDMSAWAKIYKKELFEDIRFPVNKLSEDYFIMYKLIDKAKRVAYVSEPLYNYLQRSSSITKNKNINHDFIEAANEQMEYFDLNYPELSTIGHTAYASANLTVLDFYIKNEVKCPKEKRKEFRKAIVMNMEHIQKNENLSNAKKIQFYLFLVNYRLYRRVFIMYRKIRRV